MFAGGAQFQAGLEGILGGFQVVVVGLDEAEDVVGVREFRVNLDGLEHESLGFLELVRVVGHHAFVVGILWAGAVDFVNGRLVLIDTLLVALLLGNVQ